MIFFMMAATVAPAKVPTKPVTQTQKKEAMGTVFELNQDEVLATYKGGVVKRKDVVQLMSIGINLKKPQPFNVLHEIENRFAVMLALQKYVNSVYPDTVLSENERFNLKFMKEQFITKSYLVKRIWKNISEDDIKKKYEKMQKEVLYKLSMCILDTKEKAVQILNSLKVQPKAQQKESFSRCVKESSIDSQTKKDNGTLPPLTKDQITQFLNSDLAKILQQYVKNSLIPQVFEIKGQYFIFFLNDIQKQSDIMKPLSQMPPEEISKIRPAIEAQVASENRLPQLRQIVAEGDLKINGVSQIPDEYLQMALMP